MINEEYFQNALEIPTITIQSTAAAYGHVSVNKVWHSPAMASRELNISADYLARPIENIVSTLIHEGCHLWAMQNSIKDTSNRGIYHNAHFKALAEERGLIIGRHEKYGWTITEPGERTIDFCIANGLQDIQLFRQTSIGFPTGTPKAGNSTDMPPRAKKPTSSRKYVCPCCGNIARATKEISLICGDCNVKMIWEH